MLLGSSAVSGGRAAMADTGKKTSSYQELSAAVGAGVEAGLVGLVIALIALVAVIVLNLGQVLFVRGGLSPGILARIAGTAILAGLLAGYWLGGRGGGAGFPALLAGAIAGAPSGYVYGVMGHIVMTTLNPAYAQFRQQFGFDPRISKVTELLIALIQYGPLASAVGAFAGAGAALLFASLVAPILARSLKSPPPAGEPSPAPLQEDTGDAASAPPARIRRRSVPEGDTRRVADDTARMGSGRDAGAVLWIVYAVATVGLLLSALVPLRLSAAAGQPHAKYVFDTRVDEFFIALTALAVAYVATRRYALKFSRSLGLAVVSGLAVAVASVFTYSMIYHMYYLPPRADLGPILSTIVFIVRDLPREFGAGLLISLFAGGIGYGVHRGPPWYLGWLRTNDPSAPEMWVTGALIAAERADKLELLQRALEIQPNHPVANGLHRRLTGSGGSGGKAPAESVGRRMGPQAPGRHKRTLRRVAIFLFILGGGGLLLPVIGVQFRLLLAIADIFGLSLFSLSAFSLLVGAIALLLSSLLSD